MYGYVDNNVNMVMNMYCMYLREELLLFEIFAKAGQRPRQYTIVPL